MSAGNAGSSVRIVAIDSDGNIFEVGDLANSAIRVNVVAGGAGGGSVTQGTVPWVVDGSGVTQPVSAAALPLPTGASTSALQTTGNTSLSTIAAKDFSTETTLAALNAKVTACNTGAVVITSGNVAVSATDLDIRNLVFATDKVDASGSSVTANAGTNLNTSLLALEAGGNLATIAGKDFATQTTLAALNAKVTACNTGAVVIASGSVTVSATDLDIRNLVFATDKVDISGSTVTANAGTNLNTALLALEAGGNLAALVAKDYATETTLALIKAKTDNLDVTLSGGSTHVIVDSMPPVTANSSATATEEPPDYTEGVAEALSQTLAGYLRVVAGAYVNDAPSSLTVGSQHPLSLTNDGRLRVAVAEARVSPGFFSAADEDLWGDFQDDITFGGSVWSAW